MAATARVEHNITHAGLGDLCAMLSLEQRQQAQQSRCVMHSQRAAYAAVAGGGPVVNSAPRIELF